VYRSSIEISAPCFTTATKPGGLSLSTKSVAAFENTGEFTAPGQFYVDASAGRVLVASAAAPTAVVVALTQTLMHVEVSRLR
jgi:hypothetical protein